MKIERKVLRSVSELSMFKYVLIAYLIFFILYAIIFGIIFLIGWSFGMADLAQNFGFNINDYIGAGGRSGVLIIVGIIIGGLIASVFVAAFGALATWIANVVLRISGGIELRFRKGAVPVESSESE
jgi:hypothetical protein